MDGILLLDKPLGLSSTAAGQRLRRMLRIEKVGHVGSLDPLASGMLPLCLGEATKLAGEILEGAKVYRFTVKLGARTSTGDLEGETVETQPVGPLSADQITTALQTFLGETWQIPPMYSAIKRQGQPLYKLARAGQVVEREPRKIRIESLHLLEWRAPDELVCELRCGKGTYVRVLAEDLAVKLGTVGHVTTLRRERVEPFAGEAMLTFEAIEAALARGESLPLIGLSDAVSHLPLITLESAAALRLCHGQEVNRTDLTLAVGQTARVQDEAGRFLGLGRVAAPGRLAAKRLVRQRPDA
jgi:tRNA pseudouridine55 synthase